MAHYSKDNNCTCGGSEDRTYNGWCNYETWLVNLWLTNDQSTSEYVEELVREAQDRYGASEAIREFVEEMNPLLDEASMFTDLLNGALGEVQWQDIVDHLQEI